jgi:3-methyladenine DNA glycosylase AlkD
MNCDEIIKELKKNANPKNVEGMKRFGIQGKDMLGISVTFLRKFAKGIPRDHKLAAELWKTGIHEARMLASMVDELELVTERQMDSWVKDFDSWDICDGACMNLLCKTPYVDKKIFEYAKSKKEFVRRTAFTLIACLSFKRRELKDKDLIKYFDLIKEYSFDERNFVKKAVNWALRQIGKRNANLNKKALKVAREILKLDTKSARWIAHGAINELEKWKPR